VISKTIGDNDGLLSVPWPAVDVVLDTKMNQMFKAIEVIQGALLVERVMKAFYFVHATLALLRMLARMLAQTKTHPRLSMLVGTLQHARDDLWHFLLLMSFVLGGFMLLARAQFADTFEEFSESTSSLDFLYDMMLGSLPGDAWIDPLFGLYVLMFNFFNFLVFMIMLNFIIAISVEAYMKVTASVVENEAEQEFVTDCVSILIVKYKRLR